MPSFLHGTGLPITSEFATRGKGRDHVASCITRSGLLSVGDVRRTTWDRSHKDLAEWFDFSLELDARSGCNTTLRRASDHAMG